MVLVKEVTNYLELIFLILLLLFHSSHGFPFLFRNIEVQISYVFRPSYISVKGKNHYWGKTIKILIQTCFSTSSSGLFSPPLFRDFDFISSINVCTDKSFHQHGLSLQTEIFVTGAYPMYM